MIDSSLWVSFDRQLIYSHASIPSAYNCNLQVKNFVSVVYKFQMLTNIPTRNDLKCISIHATPYHIGCKLGLVLIHIVSNKRLPINLSSQVV